MILRCLREVWRAPAFRLEPAFSPSGFGCALGMCEGSSALVRSLPRCCLPGHVSPGADSVCARNCFTVQDEAAGLKSKLEDSRKQLQGNEQMIRWLNNQVTPAHAALSGI